MPCKVPAFISMKDLALGVTHTRPSSSGHAYITWDKDTLVSRCGAIGNHIQHGGR